MKVNDKVYYKSEILTYYNHIRNVIIKLEQPDDDIFKYGYNIKQFDNGKYIKECLNQNLYLYTIKEMTLKEYNWITIETKLFDEHLDVNTFGIRDDITNHLIPEKEIDNVLKEINDQYKKEIIEILKVKRELINNHLKEYDCDI